MLSADCIENMWIFAIAIISIALGFVANNVDTVQKIYKAIAGVQTKGNYTLAPPPSHAKSLDVNLQAIAPGPKHSLSDHRVSDIPSPDILSLDTVEVGKASADLHNAHRLTSCPVGTYSANGHDSPYACQQVAAGYYPSKTAIISTPVPSTKGSWDGIAASPDFRRMVVTEFFLDVERRGSIYMTSDRCDVDGHDGCRQQALARNHIHARLHKASCHCL